MENGTDLLESTWFQVEEEAKEDKDMVYAMKTNGDLIKQNAISANNKFMQSGRPPTSLNIQILTGKILQLSSSLTWLLLPWTRLYIYIINVN